MPKLSFNPLTGKFDNVVGVAAEVGISKIGSATWKTQDDYNKLFGAVGRATGGVISDAGSNTINVTAGTGFIKATDSDTAQLLSFDWPASNGLSVPANSVRYVGVHYNSGTPEVTLKTTDTWDLDTEFPLGEAINDFVGMHVYNNPWWVTDGTTNIIERIQALGELQRDEHIGGLILSVTGTRNIAVTAGTLWSRLNEFPFAAINTAVSGTFEYYWYNGVAGTWSSSDVTQYSVTQYNDTTQATLQNLTAARYAVQWVYIEADDGHLAVVYPQNQFATIAQAQAQNPPSLIPTHLSENGKLIGKIIIQQGQDTPVSVETVFTTMFSSSLAADHGALTGLTDDDHGQYILGDRADWTDLTGGGATTLHSHAAGGSAIQDADADTKIQTEESADEDKIRFDTGGTERLVLDSSGLDFKKYKAIAMACDNGATLPTSPATGQWFLHTPTGRNVLMMYTGTEWQPIISLGAMTLYVSSTGTDDAAHGTGTGTDAFLTHQYAYTQIPGTLTGNVTINMGSGTFTGTGTLRGKVYTGNFSITIVGDVTVGADQTIASRVLATTSALGTVTVTSAGWTTDEHQGKIIKFTKIAGGAPSSDTYRVVKSNTSDTLTLVGTVVTGLVANDTFGFVTHNTVFTSNQSYYQNSVNLNLLKYDVGTAYCVNLGGSVTMNQCRLESTYNIFLETVFEMATLVDCYLSMEGASGTHSIETQRTSAITLTRTFIKNNDTTSRTNNAGIHATSQTFVAFRDNSVIMGGGTNKFGYGILIEGGGSVDHRLGSFIENCISGVKCASGGTDFSSLSPGTTYSSNTQDLTAVNGLFGSTGTLRGCHIVEGSATLVAGTIQVTLTGGAAAFSSTTSYTVLVTPNATANAMYVTNDSASQFTITSAAGADTQVVRWVAIGS